MLIWQKQLTVAQAQCLLLYMLPDPRTLVSLNLLLNCQALAGFGLARSWNKRGWQTPTHIGGAIKRRGHAILCTP